MRTRASNADSISITVTNPTEPRGTDSLTSTLVSSHSPASSKEPESESSSEEEEDDSDSSSDSDASQSESESDDGEDETTARLKALLLKAKESARARAVQAKEGGNDDGLANNEEVVLFGQEEEDEDDDDESATPRASQQTKHAIARSLVQPLNLKAPTAASLAADKGKGRATDITLGQDVSGSIEGGSAWGRAPLPSLSKKERKARHAPTAGPKWFDMPAPVMTPELKREIQAMRLRNALDPKRFYKGGAKDSKTMPEFFSFGHILPSAQGSVSTAQQGKVRKRTFVEELVQDEQKTAYAKRKFVNEVMVKGMSGRGTKGKKRGERRR